MLANIAFKNGLHSMKEGTSRAARRDSADKANVHVSHANGLWDGM